MPEQFLFLDVSCWRFAKEMFDDVQHNLLPGGCRHRGGRFVNGVCRWLLPGESDPYRSSKPIAAPGVRRSRREWTRNEKFRIVNGHGEA
jgi:hypothetical protein